MTSNYRLILVSGLIVVSHLCSAEPASVPSRIDPSKIKPAKTLPGGISGGVPRLQLKPDLIVQSLGYSNEFCESNCSDQWTRELGVTRISAETCHFVVTVKNIGKATSKPGKVMLQYHAMTSHVQLNGDMPAIRAGQQKAVIVSVNNSNPLYLYRKFNAPISATADSTNKSVESNERNNRKEIYMR